MQFPQGLPAISSTRRLRVPIALATAALLATAGLATPAPAEVRSQEPGGDIAAHVEPAEVVEVRVDGLTDIEDLLDAGIDLDTVADGTDGAVVHAVLTPTEQQQLTDAGFELGDVLYTEADWRQRLAEREAVMAANERANTAFADRMDALHGTGGDTSDETGEPDEADETGEPATDAVAVLRADYFESRNGAFLSVEAKSTEGPDGQFSLTVHIDGDPDNDLELTRFADAGVYLYHRGLGEVENRPSFVEVHSPMGGSAVAEVTEWLPPEDPDTPPHTDFVRQYMTPTDLYERIHQLEQEFGELAEVIELPHRTNGYRRVAQALLEPVQPPGAPAPIASRVVVDSKAYGSDGGNDLTIQLADPGEPDRLLEVVVLGNDILVELGTDGDGVVNTTAADVVAGLNSDPEASASIRASTFRGDTGTGLVEPTLQTPLTDFLSAPDLVSRDPHPVYALRIGTHRDGSKPGVLAYAQEHAREWVTPLVTIEAAERLLRNYHHHGPTRRLVDNLDIFILPSVNPDGGHYSFYDSPSQRKSMTNHCPENGAADPLARNQWGVDNNRNYGAYTLWDGYSGASSVCTSGNFAGPFDAGPLSQPENRNLVWVADHHPNIRFAMNVHSTGDYFMWSPGAYRTPGREPAPRPTVDEEAFFWGASSSILSAIKAHRGTVVEPGRTGPIIDVLYSAAGNSGDHLWYLNDIYAWNFEVGREGFQPPWPEAHEQALEYAGGLYRLFEVAFEFDRDVRPPRSRVVPGGGRHSGPVEVAFELSEPAAIFYTLDGSRPTFESERLRSAGVREGAETLTIEESTTISWFAVDQAGNIEKGYDPEGSGHNHNRARFVITP